MQENDIHESEELKESKEKFNSLFDMLNVEKMSLLKRWFLYIFFTLIMFVSFIYIIVKNIILLRFGQISNTFSAMNTYDELIKRKLQI